MNTKDAKCNILSTAKALFLQSGIKNVTMEVIAREGHISKKTIYQYFENKKHLLDALFAAMEVSLIEQVEQSQAAANPVASVFSIYQLILLETSPFLNDHSLQQCYAAQHEHLTGMLFTLLEQTLKVQITAGINQGFFISQVKTDEFCLLLTNVLLASLTQPTIMNQSFNKNLSAKDIIYYSLRSVITPMGLKILDQAFSSTEQRSAVSQ